MTMQQRQDLIAKLERFRLLLSAADAAETLHLAEEPVGRFDKRHVSLPAIALRPAKTRQLKTIAVIGKDGGIDDHELIVPSNVTARIKGICTFILHS
jgi:phosphoheptose isomerase